MSSDYTLGYGTHTSPDDGMCAMEWVSHLAGEPHSDEPSCVSPVLRAFCTTLNDSLDHATRQRLRPYLTRTIGTADDGLDEARSWTAMDWLVRTYAPRWLNAAGLAHAAYLLPSVPPVVDSSDLRVALVALNAARQDTRAAWAAARRAARAPWGAGRAAAREAAWRSGASAAWAAARLGVGDIAGDRARALARDIAADAAATVVREARTSMDRAAAKDAARLSLAPILKELEASAFELLDRMLPTAPLWPTLGWGESESAPANSYRGMTPADASTHSSGVARLTPRGGCG